MPFGNASNTPRINTGNVRTSFDPFNANAAFNSGLANPLGQIFMDQGGSDSVSGSLTQLPAGSVALYKYCLYKSTTNPALVSGPGVVYYTDNTFTVVSGAIGDGVTGKACDAAGLLMLNTTDLSALTATILNNSGNGSGVWVCIGGFVKAAKVAAAATGDYLYGSGSFVVTNVADGAAAPIHMPFATAVTAQAAGLADVYVRLQNDF